jgi:membrane peptidoglycan carboxypeptidase
VERVEKGAKLAPGERLEGALAAVDQTTGFVRALVGGRSYSQSGFNRILNMRRQVGSTFKPFVYLAAFEKGQDSKGVTLTPAYPLEDAPWKLTYDSGKQTWNPKNYEKGHLGWIGLRTALAHSVNTVAAKLGVEVGLPGIIQTARALGVESPLPEVPSLSLGVAELSPVELLKSYAIIANHGEQDTLTVIRLIAENSGGTLKLWVAEPQQRVSRGAADLTSDLLTNVFTEGTARDAAKLGFDRPAAGKTGTTSHHRDAWFAGFTPQLTAVVWVGQDQPSSQSKVKLTGAGSALPIWTRFMKDALAGNPVEPFPISSDLTEVRLDRHSGKRASSDCPSEQTVLEKVILGKEPEDTACDPTPPPSEKEKSI